MSTSEVGNPDGGSLKRPLLLSGLQSRPRQHLRRRVGHVCALVTAWLVSACSPECEEEGSPIQLVGATEDPSLGTFVGDFSWLQTGDETSLTFTVTEREAETFLRCDVATVEALVEASSTDEVLSVSATEQPRVLETGFLAEPSFTLSIDPAVLVERGQLPDAPMILDRDPTAQLTLSKGSDATYEALLVVRSSTDNLHVGLGTLHKVVP